MITVSSIILASVAILLTFPDLAAAAISPSTPDPNLSYQACEYQDHYPRRVYAVPMTLTDKKASKGANRNERHSTFTLTDGHGYAFVYVYPYKAPHLQVLLTDPVNGIDAPPFYLVKMTSGQARAYKMPQGMQTCNVNDLSPNVGPSDVQSVFALHE